MFKKKQKSLSWYWRCDTHNCQHGGRAVDSHGAIYAAVTHAFRVHGPVAVYEIEHRRFPGRWVRVMRNFVVTRTLSRPYDSANSDAGIEEVSA